MDICVYGASSKSIDNDFIVKTENLCEKLALRGHNLVFGGGATGLMGASARGFLKGGAKKILGISPKFFDADGVLFDKCTDFIFTDTMRERKQLLEDNSDAFLITPGGIGTYDELFEILTLKQLGVIDKPVAIYNINGYYDYFVKFMQNTVNGKFMNKSSTELYKICDSFEEIVEYIENYSKTNFDITYYKDVNKH